MLLNTDNLIVIKRAYFVKKMRSKILIMRTFQPGKTSFCQTDNEFSLIIKKFFQGLHGRITDEIMQREKEGMEDYRMDDGCHHDGKRQRHGACVYR